METTTKLSSSKSKQFSLKKTSYSAVHELFQIPIKIQIKKRKKRMSWDQKIWSKEQPQRHVLTTL